jgi:hypothetical protein
MLAQAMQAHRARTAAVLTALTMLVAVVAIAGSEPMRRFDPVEPPATREELVEIRVITPGFPVPGALPPEVYPRKGWGLDTGPDLTWLLVLMTAVGVVGLFAAAIVLVPRLLRWRPSLPRLRWRVRRRSAEAPATEPVLAEPSPVDAEADADVARQAIDAALVPLREPADPREAVIEAYARMEEVLATRELGRRTPEAPREYLRRVLREQGMPERSLTTLTELFEEARFSPHSIPTSSSGRARSELQAARAALPVHLGPPTPTSGSRSPT